MSCVSCKVEKNIYVKLVLCERAISSIATIIQHGNLPIIIVVWCDSDLGMISLKQIDEFGKSAFTKFSNPDFVKLAESFGAIGYNVKSSEEFPQY